MDRSGADGAICHGALKRMIKKYLNTGLGSIGFLVLGVFLTLILISGVLFLGFKKPSVNPETQIDTQNHQIDQTENNLLLIPEVPNFDNLNLEDLPDFVDVRSVSKYKNNLIIAGYGKVIEYSPQTGQVLRMNNSRLVNISDADLIGDFLYVVSDRTKPRGEEFPVKRMLSKVDLDSGRIVKEYFLDDQKSLANLMVQAKDANLWMSSWDGVLKLDTTNDTLTYYPPEKLQTSQNCPVDIFDINSVLTVYLNCSQQGKSIYDPQTDTWKFLTQTDYREFPALINKDASSFGLEFPDYEIILKQDQNNYLLFSNLGMFTLKRGEFPKHLNDLKLRYSYIPEGMDGMVKTIYLEEENAIFIIGMNSCGYGAQPTCLLIGAEYIDLRSNTNIDLIKDSNLATFTEKSVSDLAIQVQNGQLTDDEGKITLKRYDKTVATFDKASRRLEFTGN